MGTYRGRAYDVAARAEEEVAPCVLEQGLGHHLVRDRQITEDLWTGQAYGIYC